MAIVTEQVVLQNRQSQNHYQMMVLNSLLPPKDGRLSLLIKIYHGLFVYASIYGLLNSMVTW